MVTAEQLRAARAILQMDQADLAKVSGVSVETFNRFDDGTRHPCLLALMRDIHGGQPSAIQRIALPKLLRITFSQFTEAGGKIARMTAILNSSSKMKGA